MFVFDVNAVTQDKSLFQIQLNSKRLIRAYKWHCNIQKIYYEWNENM